MSAEEKPFEFAEDKAVVSAEDKAGVSADEKPVACQEIPMEGAVEYGVCTTRQFCNMAAEPGASLLLARTPTTFQNWAHRSQTRLPLGGRRSGQALPVRWGRSCRPAPPNQAPEALDPLQKLRKSVNNLLPELAPRAK